MKAIVLAGGGGTRLRPITSYIPKPMMPVGTKRCIDYTMSSLARAGIEEVIITTGYRFDDVVRGLSPEDELGATVLYSIEHEPLGTAGAVKKNEAFLDETFLVMSADVLADVDLGALVDFHRRKGADATMALTTVERPSEYGIVGLDDDERIERFKEKPVPEEVFSNLINAGIYVLEPPVLEYVPEGAIFDFSKNLFPRLLERDHAMYGHRLGGLWMDIGRPSDLITANQAVVRREGAESSIPGASVTGPVIVGEGIALEEGVEIEGPCLIGDGVSLGRGTRLRSAFLHGGVRVGPGSVVEESIVMGGGSVGTECTLSRSILVDGCIVGDGARMVEALLGRATRVEAGEHLEGEARDDGPKG